MVRRRPARGQGRLHPARGRLPPVLPGGVPARGQRQLVAGRRNGVPDRWARTRSRRRTWAFTTTAGDPGAGAPTATFGVTSSMIDRPAYQDSRRLAGWAAAGRRPVHAVHGQLLHGLGPRRQAYKRLYTEVDLTGQRRGQADVPDVVRPRAGLGPPVRRGEAGRHRAVDDAARRQRPHLAGHGRQLLHGRRLVSSCTTGCCNYQTVSRRHLHARPARPASGTPRPAARTAGRSGRSTWPATPARRSRSRSLPPRDWAVGNLGAWVDDAGITDRRRAAVADLVRDRHRRLADRSGAGRHAEPAMPQWTRTHRSSSRRAPWSAPTTRSTPASRWRR